MFVFDTMLLYIRPLIDDTKIYVIISTMQYILAMWLFYYLSGQLSTNHFFIRQLVKV